MYGTLLGHMSGWPDDTVRVGEFGDVKYLRMLVNLERNCYLGTDMLCYYTDNKLTDALRSGQYGGGGKFDNILDWAGWQDVGELRGRDSSNTRAWRNGNIVYGWVGLDGSHTSGSVQSRVLWQWQSRALWPGWVGHWFWSRHDV